MTDETPIDPPKQIPPVQEPPEEETPEEELEELEDSRGDTAGHA